MNSVFSNYLDPILGSNYEGRQLNPSKVYSLLRIAYNQGLTGILNATRMIVENSERDEDEIVYKTWANPEFKEWVQWVNKKITLELGQTDYRAIDVRIRIATNMLNKLVAQKRLDNEFSIKVHRNLTTNVKNEMSLINTEDLPF